jgi:hypothetical protein
MSEILKFACSAPNCGRKFNTQEKLNTHFKLRHPEIKKEKEKENKPSIEKIMKQISKPKLNPQDKHHFLQPITKRKSMSKIVTTNNKENKEDKNKKDIEEDIDLQNIPSFQEEKEKRLLNNLFGQINNLENYMEKDCEFHKEFKLPDVPDYDNMYDSDNENNGNINNKNNENKNNKKNKKQEKDKIYEITEEMILNNCNSKNSKNEDIKDDDDKYKNIHELNLSKKNIKIFKNKKNIPFEKLQELFILNLSDNLISEAKDISYFENLRELYMNNNKIEDICFCESLPDLSILNLENNNIINITSLNICNKLTVLKLSNNKIKYLNSTLRIFKNLKNLKEITIKSNPFLSELKSYFEYFISNYKNIQKLDEENITEEKRKKAEIFYKENNPLYKNITERPMSSRPGINKINKNNEENNIYDLFEDSSEENINDDINENIMSKTQINFSNNEKININNNIEDNKENKENKNNEMIKKEEENLKKIIEEQKGIIDKLKHELENSSRLNKQYEIQIEQYNNELMNIQNNNITNKKEDSKTEKIRKEIENWKKQYFDLLEKNMNKEETKLKFSRDLFNEKNKKKENQIKKDIIERPQTAQVRSNLTRDFKKLYEEINILEGNKNKNIFDDVLNEETDEEEEEEKEEKEEKDVKEKLEEEIPDDEIEEMFRKSYQDIQKMRKDLQEINKNMDNDNNLNKKNNIENLLNEDRKGNKPSLKPIIYKKDNNKNPIGNQVFTRHTNIITGNNKNINENNKNSQAQRYNALLYKLKK